MVALSVKINLHGISCYLLKVSVQNVKLLFVINAKAIDFIW